MTIQEDADAAEQALYNAVDEMNTDRRSLLVMALLGRIYSTIEHLIEAQDMNIVRPHLTVIGAMAQIAGYALNSEREKAGFTSTRDRRVDEAIGMLNTTVDLAIKTQMDPAQIETLEAVTKAVRQRVAAGEPWETVVHEEMRAAGIVPTPTAESPEPSPANHTGLYM